MNKDEALTLEALKFAASKGYGRIVHEMKITPFTIKYEEALAQPEQEPVCPECKAVVLYECVACSSNNYPPQRKPLTYCQECMRPNPIDGTDCAHGIKENT